MKWEERGFSENAHRTWGGGGKKAVDIWGLIIYNFNWFIPAPVCKKEKIAKGNRLKGCCFQSCTQEPAKVFHVTIGLIGFA